MRLMRFFNDMVNSKLIAAVFGVALTLVFAHATLFAQSAGTAARSAPPDPAPKIPWKLTVVVMDGADRVEKAEIPVREAIEFIEKRSRFVFEVDYVESSLPHGYTPYLMPREKGKKREYAYAMMGWNLPRRFVRNLPVSTSYIFLYKMNGRRPAQAGSALGLDFGLIIGGRPRPYATVPTDVHWFINNPNHGFNSWAAQILTHEIINTMQAKLEARPYRCGQLTGTPNVRPDQHEGERLASISEKCYERITRYHK